MSKVATNRHIWSWRSCFANVKHNKKKSKKQENCQSNLEKYSPNGHSIYNKDLETVDENCNLLNNYQSTTNDYNKQFLPNNYVIIINENETEENFIDNNSEEQTIVDMNTKSSNQKTVPLVKSTQLDAIVEDLNEEDSNEIDDRIKSVRLCCDRELINDSNELYTRLVDLTKMNHIIIQFNDNGYLLGDFTYHLGKFKLKIDDIKRVYTDRSRDVELLEARYSTLLATIESLSLLLKFVQITSTRNHVNRLIYSIEERIEQLNKLVQLSSSINLRQLRQDLNDDDFLSFRSALSSYEHLLTIS